MKIAENKAPDDSIPKDLKAAIKIARNVFAEVIKMEEIEANMHS